MSSVEERLSRVESILAEQGHAAESGLHGQSYGLYLVHQDTQAIRSELAKVGADVTDVKAALAEVLARLPERD